MIVLDTCALLFWTLEPARLSPAAMAALQRLDASNRGLVSSASLWEIALKSKAGRLDIQMSPSRYLDGLSRLPLEIQSVDAPLWLDSVALAWDHRDLVDRLVVSLARRHQADVVTSDGAIRSFYPAVLW